VACPRHRDHVNHEITSCDHVLRIPAQTHPVYRVSRWGELPNPQLLMRTPPRARPTRPYCTSCPQRVHRPVALLSTQPADLPLPRTASGRSFYLLALRARCEQEPMARASRQSGTRVPHFATCLELTVWQARPLLRDVRRVRSVSDHADQQRPRLTTPRPPFGSWRHSRPLPRDVDPLQTECATGGRVPVAHREHLGSFPGSIPGVPIASLVVEPKPHGYAAQACRVCRKCSCGAHPRRRGALGASARVPIALVRGKESPTRGLGRLPSVP